MPMSIYMNIYISMHTRVTPVCMTMITKDSTGSMSMIIPAMMQKSTIIPIKKTKDEKMRGLKNALGIIIRGGFTMKKTLVFVIALSFIFSVAAFAAPNYQEGLWEMTTAMDMPGLPKEMMRPMKRQVCITKQNPVPQPKEKDQQCKMTERKIVGNTVFFTVTCKNGGVSKGEMTYSKNSFSGHQTTTRTQGGKQMTVKSTMSGKYIGPCPK